MLFMRFTNSKCLRPTPVVFLVWGAHRYKLAQGASKRGRCGLEGTQTRPQASISSGRSSSRNRCSFDYRPMSRSTETSLCPVDARCRPSMDRKTLRYFGFGLDGRPVFATVGIYAAETIASRLRARPASRPALAGTRLPCNSPAGPHPNLPLALSRQYFYATCHFPAGGPERRCLPVLPPHRGGPDQGAREFRCCVCRPARAIRRR